MAATVCTSGRCIRRPKEAFRTLRKAPYYALYAGDVVILGNDEGAERLKGS